MVPRYHDSIEGNGRRIYKPYLRLETLHIGGETGLAGKICSLCVPKYHQTNAISHYYTTFIYTKIIATTIMMVYGYYEYWWWLLSILGILLTIAQSLQESKRRLDFQTCSNLHQSAMILQIFPKFYQFQDDYNYNHYPMRMLTNKTTTMTLSITMTITTSTTICTLMYIDRYIWGFP